MGEQRDGSLPGLRFDPVFRAVCWLTGLHVLLSLALIAVLVVNSTAGDEVRGALHIAETIWQMGAGAIIGLLGGKNLK